MKKLKAKFGALVLLTVIGLSGSAFGQVSGTNDDSFPDDLDPFGNDEHIALFTCFNFTTGNFWYEIVYESQLPALRIACTQSGGTVMTGG